MRDALVASVEDNEQANLIFNRAREGPRVGAVVYPRMPWQRLMTRLTMGGDPRSPMTSQGARLSSSRCLRSPPSLTL